MERSGARVTAWLAAGAAALAGSGGLSGCGGGPPTSGLASAKSAVGPAPHVATAPRGQQASAELDVVSGASTVQVSSAALGADLVRATTPANSSVKPDLISQQGTVQVYLDGTGRNGPAAVQIVLNSAITWHLLFAGGASQISAAPARLGGADFAAGTSLISLRLPRPSGTVTVELAGGASQVSLSLPAGVPARLALDGGASSAALLGRTYTGIAGGTVLTSPGWSQASARYQVTAPAGVSSIDVTG
jgi:hypothetical protein